MAKDTQDNSYLAQRGTNSTNGRRGFVDREQMHKIVDDLIDLQNQTQPSGGDTTVEFKCVKAAEARLLLERLWGKLGGWVVDHVVGECIDHEEAAHNEHIHEYVGSDYDCEYEYSNAELNRRIIARCFLYGLPLPTRLSLQARAALEALEYGETQPLLVPGDKGGKRGNHYTTWMGHLRACEHVAFRAAVYGNKQRAQIEIDEAYALRDLQGDSDGNTVKSWEHRLRNEGRLDAAYVQLILENAARTGQRVYELNNQQPSQDTDPSGEIELYWIMYTNEVLADDARNFHTSNPKKE